MHERGRAETHGRVARRAIHGESIFVDRRFDGVVVFEVTTHALARCARIHRRRADMACVASNRRVRIFEWPLVYKCRWTECRCRMARGAFEWKRTDVHRVGSVVVVALVATDAIRLSHLYTRVWIIEAAPKQSDARASQDPG